VPPRSRTKPGSTTRRPKVAGLRQHAHAATGTRPLDADPTDADDTPELIETRDVDAPSADAPTDPTTAPADDATIGRDRPEATDGDEATARDAAPVDEALRPREEAEGSATAARAPEREQGPEATVEDASPAPAGATTTAPAATDAATTTAPASTDAAAEGTRPGTVTGADMPASADTVTSTDASPTTPTTPTTPADAPDTLPVEDDEAGEASDDDRPARTAAPTRTGRGRSTGGTGERPGRRVRMAPRGDGVGTATRERPGRPEHGEDDDETATVGTTGKAKTRRSTERKASGTGKDAPQRRSARVRAALTRFAGSRALPMTLVAVIVVCLVLAGLAFWKGRQAWTTGPMSNAAVVDVSGTAELVGQTRESIEKIFSYDYTRLDDSVEAARWMSTGQFTDRYLSVFDQTIRTPAMQQQLRQTATAVNMGVVSMGDDRAEVMVLAQFSAQRTSTGQSTNAPGLLRAEMLRVDGRWKLAELNPLTAERR